MKAINPKKEYIDTLIKCIETYKLNPEFVLLFSSINALFCYPKNSSYCVANAYLDYISKKYKFIKVSRYLNIIIPKSSNIK